MTRGTVSKRDATPEGEEGRVALQTSGSSLLRRRSHAGRITQVEDVEYRPQRSAGTFTLLRACIAAAVAVLLQSLGFRQTTYIMLLPAVLAIAWFADYAVKRRLRARLTETGIESRRLRTTFIPWAQIRDVQVVGAAVLGDGAVVLGNGAAGSWGGRSERGSRKAATVRVQQADGSWLELAMPVVWENAPDPDFASKVGVIKDRWQAATGQVPAADAATS
jgi:hypothetical protein